MKYDGIGEGEDGVGGMDTGLYDTDYEAIKAYNKVAREIESDRLFWEDTKNTNQRKEAKKRDLNQSVKNLDDNYNDAGDDDDDNVHNGADEIKYRGPDKGKGGRIIGPDGKYLPIPKSRKKSGSQNRAEGGITKTNGKENGNQVKKQGDGKSKTSEEMTKIQKRRKNDNKAKIANHHRKERSLKKSAV